MMSAFDENKETKGEEEETKILIVLALLAAAAATVYYVKNKRKQGEFDKEEPIIDNVMDPDAAIDDFEPEKAEKPGVLVLGNRDAGQDLLIGELIGRSVELKGKSASLHSDDAGLYAFYNIPSWEAYYKNGSEHQKRQIDGVFKTLQNETDNGIKCALYCVRTSASKMEPCELDAISYVIDTYKIPVYIVLTDSLNKNDAAEMAKLVKTLSPNVKDTIPVMLKDFSDGDYCVKKYGKDEILNILKNNT